MPERSTTIPLVHRVLDILALFFLLLGFNILLTGGFREWTPFGRLSLTSGVRPIVIGAVLAGLRHWWLPRPTLVTRVGSAVRRLLLSADVRPVLPIVIATRLGVFVIGFLAIAFFGHEGGRAPWRIYQNEFLNLPARWDTGWYLEIAIDGYTWDPMWPNEQQNIVFFPLYPMLIRYASVLLGRETLWTGVLISWLAFFGALVYLFRMTRERFDDAAASMAVALLACYPFAYFFSTAYTESLFLLTMVGACYHFARGEMWPSAFWGVAAGLTRPNGSLLSVVLALMALAPLWREPGGSWRPTLQPSGGWSPVLKKLAFAAAPGVGMLIYSAYVYSLTGDPLQWAEQNAAWGRVYRGIDALISQHAREIRGYGLYAYATNNTVSAIQAVAVLFALVTVWPVFRRLGLPYAVLILINIIPPLLMGGLLSMGRVTSLLFPAFVWLGAAIPPTQRPAWLAIFAMLEALCAAAFFTWRQLY